MDVYKNKKMISLMLLVSKKIVTRIYFNEAAKKV